MNKRILLIDDSTNWSRQLGSALDSLDVEILKAKNVATGWNALKAGKVDLIIIDEHMPDGLGTDMLESLKNQTEYAEIPVLMTSSHCDKETMLRAVRLGAKGYYDKKSSPEDFLTRVVDLLDIS